MTPLAMKITSQLTLPVKDRSFDNGAVLALFSQDMHCFEVSAIARPIGDAMDESNVWPDVASILPDLFLPSPITWLEFQDKGVRQAYMIEAVDDWFSVTIIVDDKVPYAFEFAKYRPCTILESPDRIKVVLSDEPELFSKSQADAMPDPYALRLNAQLGKLDLSRGVEPDSALLKYAQAKAAILRFDVSAKERQIERAAAHMQALFLGNHAIAFTTLAINLINTPGVVGMKQHAPHAGFARKLARQGVGRYPLRGWSEVTVKTHTVFDEGKYESGATFRKCLHFVRSHRRQYRDGSESIVRAHWRGDPALGIKRTRYKVAA